jgi:hypothetical protein
MNCFCFNYCLPLLTLYSTSLLTIICFCFQTHSLFNPARFCPLHNDQLPTLKLRICNLSGRRRAVNLAQVALFMST